MNQQPESVFIWSNGNLSVFDSNGEQISELQFSFMELIWQEFEKRGVDPSSIKDIQTIVNGNKKYCQPMKLEDGYNTRFVDF